MFNEIEARLGDHARVERALHLYKVYTDDKRAFKFVDIGVQRDRYTYLVVAEDLNQADALIDIYTSYLNGEVYTVAHEKRKRYVDINNHEDYIDNWEEVDALGGCYLDTEYTAEVVAREHFDI